jgi:hypothetical protein
MTTLQATMITLSDAKYFLDVIRGVPVIQSSIYDYKEQYLHKISRQKISPAYYHYLTSKDIDLNHQVLSKHPDKIRISS